MPEPIGDKVDDGSASRQAHNKVFEMDEPLQQSNEKEAQAKMRTSELELEMARKYQEDARRLMEQLSPSPNKTSRVQR